MSESTTLPSELSWGLTMLTKGDKEVDQVLALGAGVGSNDAGDHFDFSNLVVV